jgi:hypothetical protein
MLTCRLTGTTELPGSAAANYQHHLPQPLVEFPGEGLGDGRRVTHQIYGHLVPSSLDRARTALDNAYQESRKQKRPAKRY